MSRACSQLATAVATRPGPTETRFSRRPRSVFDPYAPAGPGGPFGPCAPCGPCTPCAPCRPWMPCGPSGPAGPRSPFCPRVPSGPAGPTPNGPIGPAEPCGPAAPCGPGGPIGPVSPAALPRASNSSATRFASTAPRASIAASRLCRSVARLSSSSIFRSLVAGLHATSITKNDARTMRAYTLSRGRPRSRARVPASVFLPPVIGWA